MRSSMSLAVMARLARVTTTSDRPPVSSPVDVVRPQRLDRRARPAPLPVWPRSGARNTGDVGGGAGVVDQIADAHEFGGDRDQFLEPRRRGRRVLRGRLAARARRAARA